VGHALIEELTRAGEYVRAATRNPSGFTVSTGVEPVLFDYTDPSTFEAALEGVDRVFLMEPQPPLGAAHKIMIPFVEAAARGMHKIVMMSSLSVEFDTQEPLREVESALKRSGAPFVILRPNWFMDNFHTLWLEPMKQAGIIPLPAADSRSAFIDSRDIAAAAAAAIRGDQFNGRTFALTGPEALGYEDAASTLSKATGRTIQYVPVDDTSFIQSLVDAGLPGDYAQYVTGLFRHTRMGLAAKLSRDVEELTRRTPRTLAQYAQDHASAWA